MTKAEALFERFDHFGEIGQKPNSVRDQQARVESYQEGFAAGEAAAKIQASEDQARLAALADQMAGLISQFDREAATVHIAALMSSLSKLLPSVAKAGFLSEAMTTLVDCARANSDVVLSVFVAPSRLDAFQATISKTEHKDRFRLTEDPTLGDTAMRVSWDNGGIELDLDAAAEQILAALKTLEDELEKGLSQ